jgi:hypothetical protein
MDSYDDKLLNEEERRLVNLRDFGFPGRKIKKPPPMPC